MSVMMPSTRELPARPTAGLLPCKAEADDHNQGRGGARPLMSKGFLGRRRSGDSSGSSSSIGVPGESSESPSDEEGEMEVQSKLTPSRPLRTLGSLEDSLPIKRGLSSHFSGKSKSFASLADVVTKPTATASDLAKPENPFNKRRRILMMAKRSSQLPRRASCSSLLLKEDEEEGEEGSSPPYPPHPANANAASVPRYPPLPLRPLREEQGDEESGDDTSSTGSWMAAPLPPAPRRLSIEGGGRPLSSFRPPRSFSLTNLQQHQCADDD